MALTEQQRSTVRRLAQRYGIPAAFALGVVDKESAGRAFYTVKGEQRPAIRIEGHYVYRRLPASKKAEAVKLGLAHAKAGGLKNPNNMAARYTLLGKIIEFAGAEIAYQSISMGIGQVMGSNFEVVGAGSARNMFQQAYTFEGQVQHMLAFIANTPKALKAAKAYEYENFAKVYNGSAAKESYWLELAQFVRQYLNGTDAPSVPVKHTADLERIKALGFDSVMSFQSNRGIKVDGIIGPITLEQIDLVEAERKKAAAIPVKETAVAIGGAVAAGSAGLSLENIQQFIPLIRDLAPLGGRVLLVGVVIVAGIVGFNLVRSRFTRVQP